MFSLTLWKIKRVLMKEQPGFSMTKKTAKRRFTAEVTEDGTRKYSVHKLIKVGDKKYWFYWNYKLDENGEIYEIRSGKYPYQFTNKE